MVFTKTKYLYCKYSIVKMIPINFTSRRKQAWTCDTAIETDVLL